MEYLVTTDITKIPADKDIIMIDGTVPGWTPRSQDFHFDHHREDGEDIQLDEIPYLTCEKIDPDCSVIVTTQVDADAIVAAAWVQYADMVDTASWRKLRAIAHDCDHLYVPKDLEDLADFAAQAVATLKESSNTIPTELGLPSDLQAWNADQKCAYASEAFKRGTEWIIEAIEGKRKFPGESGEAKEYWIQVGLDVTMFLRENRVSFYKGCSIIDCTELKGKYIDPRASLRAIKEECPYLKVPYPYRKNDEGEDVSPITLTVRDRYENGEYKGVSYTLGNIPWHPETKDLESVKSGVFTALTVAEKKLNPGADGWGGRKTVGGSGWRTPSNLSPTQVIDIVVEAIGRWKSSTQKETANAR